MVRIMLDDFAASKLQDAGTNAELCDASGRVLGYFRPAVDKSDYEGVECPVSDEELRLRAREGGGRPLRDILADLERSS
jgi:hypothetical protein